MSNAIDNLGAAGRAIEKASIIARADAAMVTQYETWDLVWDGTWQQAVAATRDTIKDANFRALTDGNYI